MKFYFYGRSKYNKKTIYIEISSRGVAMKTKNDIGWPLHDGEFLSYKIDRKTKNIVSDERRRGVDTVYIKNVGGKIRKVIIPGQTFGIKMFASK